MTGSPDLSEFDQYAQRDQKKLCKIGAIREQLDATQLAQLDAAVESGYNNKAILGWLEARGYGPAMTLNSALSSHRRKTCTCGKAES